MTDDEIRKLSGLIFYRSNYNEAIEFARAIESRTLTNQKAKWYQEGLEAGLRQALAEQSVKQATKSLAQEVIGCFDAAKVEGLYSALAETTNDRLRDLVVRRLMYALYAAEEALSQALEESPDSPTDVVEPDTGIDRGAWSDVPDATKWVDELRGGDEQSEWVELTDEDIEELRRNGAHSVSDADFRAIEAKLKELNHA